MGEITLQLECHHRVTMMDGVGVTQAAEEKWKRTRCRS